MFENIFLLPFIGAFVGVVSGFFGIGGGTILVPIMIAFGYDIKVAIGISVMQMFISAVFGSYFNYKRAKFELKYAFSLGFGAVCGSLLSGIIVSNIPGFALKIALCLAIAFSFYRLIKTNVHTNTANISLHPALLFVVGLIIASFAISIGMGGAVFLTPLLVGVLGVDIKKAVSLGLFFVIFSSFGGFVSLSFAGLVDFKAGILLSLGSLVGVYFGTLAHHKIEKTKQKYALMFLNIITFCLVLKSLFSA